MAKLHFFYSVMNAGKSTALLQAAHNYETNDWRVYYFTSAIDERTGAGKISSRIGISRDAVALSSSDKFSQYLSRVEGQKAVIFVDEIQFFTEKHIDELAFWVDKYSIPVLCYGLKNNSNGELFGPAIVKLLALADQIKELKTVCHCGAKATQILRVDKNGHAVLTEDVVETGFESRYRSVCRKHWKAAHNLLKN